MAKTTLPNSKGKEEELKVGTVLESSTPKAKTPLVVYRVAEAKMGKEETLTEFALADKSMQALSRTYTAFQLERYGYKVARKSKGFDPKKVKPATERIVVDLSNVQKTLNGGEVVGEIKKLPAADDKSKKAHKDAQIDQGVSESENMNTTSPKQSDDGTRDSAAFNADECAKIVEAYVYGVEPEDFEALKARLIEFGVDIKALMKSVDEACNAAVIAAQKKEKTGER